MFKKTTDRGVRVDTPRRIPADEQNQRARMPPERGGANGRLTVGQDIRLKGAAIEDCDTLFVEGRVEASMDSRLIQIAETGAFLGAAAVDEAEIHGRFDGDLTVRDRLVIHKTGRVCGTIRYGRLEIEEGGEIAGDIAAERGHDDTGGHKIVGPATPVRPSAREPIAPMPNDVAQAAD